MQKLRLSSMSLAVFKLVIIKVLKLIRISKKITCIFYHYLSKNKLHFLSTYFLYLIFVSIFRLFKLIIAAIMIIIISKQMYITVKITTITVTTTMILLNIIKITTKKFQTRCQPKSTKSAVLKKLDKYKIHSDQNDDNHSNATKL